MFNGDKYITKGISATIPEFLQLTLWYIVETMAIKEKDYLQVFELSEVIQYGKIKQKIIHFQEQPKFKKKFVITTKETITEKIYIINDGKNSTMLLASEY
jgi:hypothetical protein